MYIITVATHDEAYFNALKKSCIDNKLNLTILGWGEYWRGLTWKFDLMKNFIKDLPDTEIVIFTDAYDVICLEGIDKILKKFKSFKKPIVFGINNPLNFIIPKVFDRIVFETYLSSIVNTGCYIGYVYALKIMLNELFSTIKINNKICDQKIFNKFYKKNKFGKENIGIDTKGLLFFNAAPKYLSGFFTDNYNTDLITKNNNIINPLTCISPSFIHGPGNLNLDKYCELLNYPIRIKRRNQNRWIIKYYLTDIIKLLIIYPLMICSFMLLIYNIC